MQVKESFKKQYPIKRNLPSLTKNIWYTRDQKSVYEFEDEKYAGYFLIEFQHSVVQKSKAKR